MKSQKWLNIMHHQKVVRAPQNILSRRCFMEASARSLLTPEVGQRGSGTWGRSSHLSCPHSSRWHRDPGRPAILRWQSRPGVHTEHSFVSLYILATRFQSTHYGGFCCMFLKQQYSFSFSASFLNICWFLIFKTKYNRISLNDLI